MDAKNHVFGEKAVWQAKQIKKAKQTTADLKNVEFESGKLRILKDAKPFFLVLKSCFKTVDTADELCADLAGHILVCGKPVI